MPQAVAIPREARNECVGQIFAPNPNCQKTIVAIDETRKVARKIFTVDASLQHTIPVGSEFRKK